VRRAHPRAGPLTNRCSSRSGPALRVAARVLQPAPQLNSGVSEPHPFLMCSKIILTSWALALGCGGGKAQSPRSVLLVAVLGSIHADSAGRATHGGHPIAPRALDSLPTELKHTAGGTIWYNWSGGPERPRTEAQEQLLRYLRASGVRVELRTDSITYSRVIRQDAPLGGSLTGAAPGRGYLLHVGRHFHPPGVGKCQSCHDQDHRRFGSTATRSS
jgi:hypothetical protein